MNQFLKKIKKRKLETENNNSKIENTNNTLESENKKLKKENQDILQLLEVYKTQNEELKNKLITHQQVLNQLELLRKEKDTIMAELEWYKMQKKQKRIKVKNFCNFILVAISCRYHVQLFI